MQKAKGGPNKKSGWGGGRGGLVKNPKINIWGDYHLFGT